MWAVLASLDIIAHMFIPLSGVVNAKGLALYGNPITFLCLGFTGLTCLSILLWPFVVYTSIFLFEAPDSQSNPATWFTAFLMLSYPITVAFGTFVSWKAHKSTNSLQALGGVVICSINFLFLFLAFNLKLW